jgi:hypothetical protein
MKIQYNTDKTVNGNQKHQDYFSTQIAEQLARFQSDISRIEVHISDENGKKEGSNNIRCLLEARIEGKQPFAVSCMADTIDLAVTGAIDKLKASSETTIGRQNNG